jgi:hypothetical protein
MARDGESPPESPIINQFNNSGWQYFNLKANLQEVTYPYNEYYQRISPDEQGRIDSQITNKTRQF